MGRNGGFTLVELMVAVAVAALVVAMAHRVVKGVLDGSAAIATARVELDREANARRVLQALVGSIDVNAPGGGFAGGPDRMAFTAWYRDGNGLWARGRVTLAVHAGALTVQRGPTPPYRLFDGVTALGLDYLLEQGAEERWVRQWISPASAPEAVRFRIGREAAVDTLLALVGARG